MLYDDLPQPKSDKCASGCSQATGIISTPIPPQINSSTGNIDNTRPATRRAKPRQTQGTLGSAQGGQEDRTLLQAPTSEPYNPNEPNVYATVKSYIQPSFHPEVSSSESISDAEAADSDIIALTEASKWEDAPPSVSPAFESGLGPSTLSRLGPLQATSAVSRMMSKMGYEKGQGLGSRNQGRLNPVIADGNVGRLGLGICPGGEGLHAAERRMPRRKVAGKPSGSRKRRAEGNAQALCVANLPAIDNVEEELEKLCRGLNINDIKRITIECGGDGTRAIISLYNSLIATGVLALDGLTWHDNQLRVSIIQDAPTKAVS